MKAKVAHTFDKTGRCATRFRVNVHNVHNVQSKKHASDAHQHTPETRHVTRPSRPSRVCGCWALDVAPSQRRVVQVDVTESAAGCGLAEDAPGCTADDSAQPQQLDKDKRCAFQGKFSINNPTNAGDACNRLPRWTMLSRRVWWHTARVHRGKLPNEAATTSLPGTRLRSPGV